MNYIAATFLIGFLQVGAPADQNQIQDLKWTKTLRPGVSLIQEVRFSEPLVIHALKFKYPAEGVVFETRMSRDEVYARDGLSSRETVAEMAERTGAFAAVNADFFGWDGDPLGIQITRGELVSEPLTPRIAAAWADSPLVFDAPVWKGQLLYGENETFSFNGVNRSTRANEAVINTFKAGVASSKQPCYAFVFELKEEAYVGRVLKARLKNIFPEVSNMPIPPGEAVLMARPSRAKELLNKLYPGMEYEIRFDLVGQVDWKGFKEAVGGGPRLVKEGKPSVSFAYERFDNSFSATRHPRTAIGYTPAGEVVLCVVDGRSAISRGATLDEMAAIMIKLGCSEAINLDGGGSSTMYVGGSIINRPSDGVLRPIANALLLFLPQSEPVEQKLAIVCKPGDIKPNTCTTLTVVDSSGAAVPNSEIVWSCSGAAWIDGGGSLRALAPGKARVSAVARGAKLTLDLDIVK